MLFTQALYIIYSLAAKINRSNVPGPHTKNVPIQPNVFGSVKYTH